MQLPLPHRIHASVQIRDDGGAIIELYLDGKLAGRSPVHHGDTFVIGGLALRWLRADQS